MQDYRDPKSDMVLVATDVAARGLDIDNIDVVIQMSVHNVDSFVHRTGRTGRAGKEGRNIVLFEVDSDKSNIKFFKKIEESLKCNFKYTNLIMNLTKTTEADADALTQENLRVSKI